MKPKRMALKTFPNLLVSSKMAIYEQNSDSFISTKRM